MSGGKQVEGRKGSEAILVNRVVDLFSSFSPKLFCHLLSSIHRKSTEELLFSVEQLEVHENESFEELYRSSHSLI